MVKVLSFRFQQCFDPCTVLVFEGSSETGIFRHLSNSPGDFEILHWFPAGPVLPLGEKMLL